MRLSWNVSKASSNEPGYAGRNRGEIVAAGSQGQVSRRELLKTEILTAGRVGRQERPESLRPGHGAYAAQSSREALKISRKNETLLTFFAAHELFRGIAMADVEKIASLSYERRYPRSTTIYVEGDPSDAMYIVMSGLVKLVSLAETGAETILHILVPGEVFGEPLFGDGERSFTAIAIEDAVVIVISREHIAELLHSIPPLALNLLALISKHLIRVQQRLAQSSHTWSYHRLAKVLLQLAERYGADGTSGTVIQLPLTHEDLANLIGTTRETVTTQLSRFKRMGLVSQQGRRFVVVRSALGTFIHSALYRSNNGSHCHPSQYNGSVLKLRDTSTQARWSTMDYGSKPFVPRRTSRGARGQERPIKRRFAGAGSLAC